MGECSSFEDYKIKFYGNQKLSGYGLYTTMHVPCPFCAEPDFMVHRILDPEAAYTQGAVCAHCKRGMRGIIRRDVGSVWCSFVQTCGDPPPPWLPAPPHDVNDRSAI